MIFDIVVIEIIGKDKVEVVRLKNVKIGEEIVMEVDGVFIFIGYELKIDFVKYFGIIDEYGYILVDMYMCIKVLGIFVVGDIINVFK